MSNSLILPVWKGVFIEEGFVSNQTLRHARVVKTITAELAGEEGPLHFHQVEVADEQLDAAVRTAERDIKYAWYFHLVKDDVMVVVFQGKTFRFERGDVEKLAEIRDYGIAQGILEEQLRVSGLFDHPYGA